MALRAEGAAALDCFEVTLKCEDGDDDEEAVVVAVIPRPEPMLRGEVGGTSLPLGGRRLNLQVLVPGPQALPWAGVCSPRGPFPVRSAARAPSLLPHRVWNPRPLGAPLPPPPLPLSGSRAFHPYRRSASGLPVPCAPSGPE